MGDLCFSTAEVEVADVVGALFGLSEGSRFSLYEENEISFLPGNPEDFDWMATRNPDEAIRTLRSSFEREGYFGITIYDSVFSVALICSIYVRKFKAIVPVCMARDEFEVMIRCLLNELKLEVNKIEFSDDFSEEGDL